MSRFRRNAGLEHELRATSEFRRELARAAEPARARAEGFAKAASGPWLPRRGSGTNQTIVVDISADGVRLVNLDHAAHLLEWGSANNPPHAPLRRGVRAAGLRLEENT